jgi:hypothetical protein
VDDGRANQVTGYDTSNYRYIVFLAFLSFGNIYVENALSLAGHWVLCPTHDLSVIRQITC